MSHEYIETRRSLTENEIAVVTRFVSEDFPGAPTLRGHLSDLEVSAQCSGCASVLFKDTSPTRADVEIRVPVEAAESGEWYPGRVHVLLHVVDGLLDELEIFREDGSPVAALPLAEHLTFVVNEPLNDSPEDRSTEAG
jgi:hypothetical protein